MAIRKSKLVSLKDAVAQIEDGSRVAIGGFAIYQKPMALVHEIIRARKRDLTLVVPVASLDVDILVGAGCVRAVETSYVGLERFGLASNFRRALQDGKIEIVHYPEMLAFDRFRANQEGLSFWPTYCLGGSDILNKNDSIKPFQDPITGRQLFAIPAANPDYVLLHFPTGDIYGNLQRQAGYQLPQGDDLLLARSTRKLIASVEKVIDVSETMKQVQFTGVGAFRTISVCEAPHGSYPTATLSLTKTDDKHFQEYVEASKSYADFNKYLDKYIYGVSSFQEYLEMIGGQRLKEIEEAQ